MNRFQYFLVYGVLRKRYTRIYTKKILKSVHCQQIAKYITVTNLRLDLPQLSPSKASQSLGGLMALLGGGG